METRLKEVLAVVNNKGGVGKTTTVQSLAVAITRQNRAAKVLCIDLDHLDDDSEAMKRKIGVEEMKQVLLSDPYWGDKTLLMFTSPRGHGLKVFVEIELDKCDYATWFNAIRNYLMKTYGLGEKQVDSSVANISHACFMSYDPDAYLRADLFEFFI